MEVCIVRAHGWHSVGNWYVDPPSLTNKEGSADLKNYGKKSLNVMWLRAMDLLNRSLFVLHCISPHRPHHIDRAEHMFIFDNNKNQDLDVDWINQPSSHLETQIFNSLHHNDDDMICSLCMLEAHHEERASKHSCEERRRHWIIHSLPHKQASSQSPFALSMVNPCV